MCYFLHWLNRQRDLYPTFVKALCGRQITILGPVNEKYSDDMKRVTLKYLFQYHGFVIFHFMMSFDRLCGKATIKDVKIVSHYLQVPSHCRTAECIREIE